MAAAPQNSAEEQKASAAFDDIFGNVEPAAQADPNAIDPSKLFDFAGMETNQQNA